MPLVEYGYSSEDEDAEAAAAEGSGDDEDEDEGEDANVTVAADNNRSSTFSSHRASDTTSKLSVPSIEKLPDASLLLDSPAFSSQQMSESDHFGRVSAAMAENASRKRESNGTISSIARNKYPRGNLPQSRNVPDMVGTLLVPPQLKGRSNVVTEDIGKLFVKREPQQSS